MHKFEQVGSNKIISCETEGMNSVNVLFLRGSKNDSSFLCKVHQKRNIFFISGVIQY